MTPNSMKLAYSLFYTGTFDNFIENAGKVFTGVRSLDVSKREQSRPQDQFTIGLITHTPHNEVRCGTEK